VCHVEYFHDHVRIEEMLFDGTLSPKQGALEPDLSRPGMGLNLGAQLERHPMFPQRANIGVVSLAGENRLRFRVWERGVGITIACGTGACAAAVAAVRRGLTGRKVTVLADGGALEIDWRADGHVLMTGPAAISFTRHPRPHAPRLSASFRDGARVYPPP